MKILLLIGRTVIGGHVISTLTLAKALQAKGHEVYFGAGKGALVDEIKKQGIRYIEIPFFLASFKKKYTYFSLLSWITIKKVIDIVKTEHIEIIHALDAPASIIADFVTIAMGVPALTTVCGGPGPVYPLPKFQKLIVFSEENKKKMIEDFKWKEENIVVIRNRIDFQGSIKIDELEGSKYEWIKSSCKKIIMASRFDAEKLSGIFYCINAIKNILQTNSNVALILIGDGSSFDKIKMYADEINNKIGRQGIILPGAIVNANVLLQYADIVLGIGRGALEGMFWGKPTIIVGENGFAGVVEEGMVEELGYYNFSGRNLKGFVGYEKLEDKISQMLDNHLYALKVGMFGRQYLEQEFDIAQGVEMVEKIYANILSEGKVSLKIRIKSFGFSMLNVCRILAEDALFSTPIEDLWRKIKKIK